MHLQKKIVLTGATYAGKSTLLDLLTAKNYHVLPEAGAIIIAELNGKFGIDGQKQWRKENPAKFYKLIMDKQQELETALRTSKNNITFLDRAIPDYIAFLKLVEANIDENLWDIAKGSSYDLVIVCGMLEGFDERVSSGRSLNKDASQKLGLLTKQVYEQLGHPTYLLEVMPVAQRMQKILELIKDN